VYVDRKDVRDIEIKIRVSDRDLEAIERLVRTMHKQRAAVLYEVLMQTVNEVVHGSQDKQAA